MSTKIKKLRKQIELTCPCCNKLYSKDLSEHNRNIKKNRISYCSISCSAKVNIKNTIQKGKMPVFDIAKWNKENVQANPFKYYIKLCNTKNRNKIVDIDINYLKVLWDNQQGKCPYTNFDLKLQSHVNHGLHKFEDWYLYASLDRIDSNLGYIKGNVQFISVAINFMKNKFSSESVFRFLKLIKTDSLDSN